MQLNGFGASKKRVFRAAESICAFFSFRKNTYALKTGNFFHTLTIYISRAVFYIRYTRGPLILTDAVAEEGRSALGRHIYAHNSHTGPR